MIYHRPSGTAVMVSIAVMAVSGAYNWTAAHVGWQAPEKSVVQAAMLALALLTALALHCVPRHPSYQGFLLCCTGVSTAVLAVLGALLLVGAGVPYLELALPYSVDMVLGFAALAVANRLLCGGED